MSHQPTAKELMIRAREEILGQALIAFVEDVDGRVPSDPEIVHEGTHVQMADGSPIGNWTHQGHRFRCFFGWRKKHLVAYDFPPAAPLELKICRVPAEEWPPAVRLVIMRGNDVPPEQQQNNPPDP